MGIFDRFSRLIKSNANAALDGLQSTAKELDQLVIEMEEAQKRARRETVEQMAAEKLARTRVGTVERELSAWQRRAEEAVSRGDDHLAREALARAGEAEQTLASAQREVAAAAAAVAAQHEALKRLDVRLRDVKARKGTIQAKVALGRQQGLRADSLDDFERMAGRIDDSEHAGEAEAEMAEVLGRSPRDAQVEARLAALDTGGVEDRLAALKKKMEGK